MKRIESIGHFGGTENVFVTFGRSGRGSGKAESPLLLELSLLSASSFFSATDGFSGSFYTF